MPTLGESALMNVQPKSTYSSQELAALFTIDPRQQLVLGCSTDDKHEDDKGTWVIGDAIPPSDAVSSPLDDGRQHGLSAAGHGPTIFSAVGARDCRSSQLGTRGEAQWQRVSKHQPQVLGNCEWGDLLLKR